MIRGDHSLIRTAEPDDGPFFQALYDPNYPRAALLTRTRDYIIPTLDEARQIFADEHKNVGEFYAVEDLEGRVRGFCALRSSQELRNTAFLADLTLLLIDLADYETLMAHEAYEWLHRIAFVERRLNKLTTHALENETAWREFLVARGFESDGAQREVLFTQGHWHNKESLALFRAARSSAQTDTE